jgi:hypothetical protein
MNEFKKMDATAGNLKSGFNWSSVAVPALVSVATFCVMGYVDNAIFDVFFFDPIHGSENGTATALKNFMLDNFGWVHEMTGFTGDGGLLHSWPFEGMLAPYYPAETGDLTSALAGLGGGDVAVDAASSGVEGSTDYIDSLMNSDYSEYDY